jgi:ferritin
VKKLFEEVYAHEQRVTASIHELVKLSIEENDHTTNLFLQWYIEEQKEEEALMRTILDKIKLIGEGPQSLYYIDKEIEQINQQTLSAEAAEE